MHKFPELKTFLSRIESRRLYRKLSHNTFVQFLHYLSKIKDIHIMGLAVDVDTIGETFEKFWETTSSIGSEDVNISFGSFLDESAALEIERLNEKNETKICYDEAQNHKYLDFIRRNGKFIKSITISNTENGVVPDDILSEIIPLCPYLQNIHMDRCTLKQCELSLDDDRKISLNELSFKDCTMPESFLEELSYNIKKIKQARFILCNDMIDDEDSDDDDVYILSEYELEHTQVDSVLIQANFGPNPCYAILGSYDGYFYRFNKDGKREEVSGEEIAKIDRKNNYCFGIGCLNKTDLIIKH